MVRLLLASLLVLSATSPVASQETEQTPELQEHHADEHVGLLSRRTLEGDEGFLSDRPFLFGDWAGWRGSLEEAGVALQLGFVSDSSWPLSGGDRKRRTDRALSDIGLELDLARLLGLPRTTAFAEYYSTAGRNGSDDVGDLQAYSNLDADSESQLAELWVEHWTAEEGLRVKLGKLDANAEFAHVNAGFGFLHSSAGFSPTIFLLPTYPDPAVSVNVFARPADGWSVGLGIYDSEDDGVVSGRKGLTPDLDAVFAIGQVDRFWEDLGGLGEGRLVLGGWLHTGDTERFDGGGGGDTGGGFAILEQRLMRETDGSEQGTVGFLQWGIADEDVTEFAAHYAAGLLRTGLFPSFDTWETGLYASYVDLSDESGAPGGHELAIELFQEIPLTPYLVLQPDLQWIDDPGGKDGPDDAWVFTLRAELFL